MHSHARKRKSDEHRLTYMLKGVIGFAVVFLVLVPLFFPLSSSPSRSSILPFRQLAEDSRSRVAFVVTMLRGGAAFVDGAAVLAQSVREIYQHSQSVNALLVALVHTSVDKEHREAMALAGYDVQIRPTPVHPNDIQSELRHSVNKSGCCGADEMVKFWAFKLEEYDRFVLLDADVIEVKSIPDEMLNARNKMVYYTGDYSMMTPATPVPPVQGGWLVGSPDAHVFDEIMGIFREGDFTGQGWRKSNVGWFYGGDTFQGLSAFYFIFRPKDETPPEAKEVDGCVFNNMGQKAENGGPDCRQTDPASIIGFHFTNCQKPWKCWIFDADDPNSKSCRMAHWTWHTARSRMIKELWELTPEPSEECLKRQEKEIPEEEFRRAFCASCPNGAYSDDAYRLAFAQLDKARK